MSFFECEFPTVVSYGASGGSRFSTNVNEGFSGFEQRNKNWHNSRGKWAVSLVTPASFDGNRQSFIDLLHTFFLVVGGKQDGFRLKDHKDFKFTDQQIGIGDGSTTQFQLTKSYLLGGRTYIRTIQKPIWHTAVDYQGNALPDTVTVKVNGTPATFTLDATTGIVTMTSAPAVAAIVTASGQFHFPARLDTDEFDLRLEESDVSGGHPIGSWGEIPIVEIRL